MIYEYECAKCESSFDVAKPVKDMEREEACSTCQQPAVRKFIPSRVFLSGTKVQHAEYNPGLGCVVKSAYDRSEQAKRKGLIEVGNDYKSGENMQNQFDKARTEKLEKRYEDI